MKNLVPMLFKTSIVALLILLTGCDASQQQPSEVDMLASNQSQAQQQVAEVLKTFIDASIARDYQAYYQLLSEQDKAIKTPADFVAEKQAGGVTLADAFYTQINYRIEDVIIDNGRAQVVVDYRYPNVEYMIKDMFGLSILSDFTQDEIVKMKGQLEQAYQDKPLPMKASTRHYVLLQEAPGWRVLMGWKKSPEK